MKRMLIVLLFACLVVIFWRGLSLEPQRLPSVQIGKLMPSLTLPLLGKGYKNLRDIPHQVVLLNVWASWCESCKDEHEFLVQQAQEGVAIYGLNYKDEAKNAQSWLNTWGNPYQLIFSDSKGLAGLELGVYGTPETFIIDKHGIIQYRYAGALNEQVWKAQMLPLIKQLERAS